MFPFKDLRKYWEIIHEKLVRYKKLALISNIKKRTTIKRFLPIIIVLCMLPLFAGGLAQLGTAITISNTGNVKTIGVGIYGDSNFTNRVTSISWGMIDPGSSSNVTVYIMNEGNVPVTLHLYAQNWNPENASDYISLSWNYGEQALDPNEVIQVTLTLLISNSIEGITNYSFDIIIAATA